MINRKSTKILFIFIIIGCFALKDVNDIHAETIPITSSQGDVVISIPLFSFLEENEPPIEEKDPKKNVVEQVQQKVLPTSLQKRTKKVLSKVPSEKHHTITVTAYSSTRAQTDSTPCITANGFNVCAHNTENVVAANFLPFGTKLRFPDHFDDRVFTVQDRMHRRYSKRVDVWMKSTVAAKKFGVKKLRIEIISESLAGNF